MSTPDPARCPHCFGATRVTPCPHCGWQPGQDNPPPALTLGRILDGRYRIGRVLGHGGFGITYLAWDDNLHLRLAIKEYLPRDSATRAPDGVSLTIYSGQAGEQFAYGLDRFLEEARALAHFDQHPGIVTVKNFFRAHGTGYCVMDYVEGITLRQYLEQQPGGRISVADALKLLMPVMDALRAVHKEGLLHRDLAPDNIYLTADGRIKLLDFGAARFAASEHSKSLSIILKPGYAPEEQYRSKGKQGPWTDVYGLAATLYRTITGSVPPEALDRTEEDELLPPSKQGIAIQPHQEAVLLKALAIKAPLRYQSISEFQQAWRTTAIPLSDSLAAAGAAESTPAPVIPAPGTAHTGQAGFSLALAGIVALLAVAGTALWSDKPEPALPPMVASQPRPAQTDPAPAVPIITQATSEVTLAPAAPDTPSPPMTTTAPTVPAAPLTPAEAELATAPAEDAVESAITQTPAKPGEKAPIYFAAESPPKDNNIPAESPLCYKFMIESPEDQLKKLKAKYPDIYNDSIITNQDGTKKLLAYRKDGSDTEISYFYTTSPEACSDYQRGRFVSLSSGRILTSIFGQFNNKYSCWIYLKDFKRYCYKIDRSDEITTKNGRRSYILTTAYSIDEQGKPNGCHGCPGLIGAFVIEERDGKMNLIAGNKDIEIGSFGSAPTNWDFIKLGPNDYWGWQNTSGYMYHGIAGSDYNILAPYGKTIRELAGIPKSFNNEGHCENPSCEESIDSSLKIDDRSFQEKVFPLHIEAVSILV